MPDPSAAANPIHDGQTSAQTLVASPLGPPYVQNLHYEALLAASLDAIFIETPEGVILDCNEVGSALYGYTRQELVGRSALDLVPEEVARSFPKLMARHEAQGGAYIQASGRKKDGTVFPVEVSTRLVRTGPDPLVVAYIRDISDRQRAAQALDQERSLVSALMDTVGALVVVMDRSGRIVRFNRASEQATGYREAQVRGETPWQRLIPPEDAPATERAFATLAGGMPSRLENDWIRQDGSRIRVSWSNSILKDAQGQVEYVIATGLDVTDLRRTEEALQAHLRWLDEMVSALTEAIFATDIQGRVTYLNRAAAELAECSLADLQGALFRERSLPGLQVARGAPEDIVLACIETGQTIHLPGKLFHAAPDGERVLQCTSSPVHDQEGGVVGAVVVIRDVTAQDRAERELVRAQRLEAVGILAGGIAHDFNNLLTAIAGNLALHRMEPHDPARSRIADAEQALGRAREITAQLLTFSRTGSVSRGSTTRDPSGRTTDSLVDLIQESSSLCLHGSTTTCRHHIAPDLWPVEANPGHLSQVLNNLIINADQAMPGGGSLDIHAVNFQVEPSSRLPLAPGRYVRLSVVDQGEGILPQHLPRIFDPYFTTKPRGTGLGLASTRSIVSSHRGHIEVESRPGHGSAFHVYLPALVRREEPAREDPHSAPPSGHGRILVMDDDPSVRDVAAGFLSRLGYQPEVAADGEEAIFHWEAARLSGVPYRGLLADLTVRGAMGGVETVRRLLPTNPDLRAVLTTGYPSAPAFVRYQDHGFRVGLVKPYDLDSLARALRQALEGP